MYHVEKPSRKTGFHQKGIHTYIQYVQKSKSVGVHAKKKSRAAARTCMKYVSAKHTHTPMYAAIQYNIKDTYVHESICVCVRVSVASSPPGPRPCHTCCRSKSCLRPHRRAATGSAARYRKREGKGRKEEQTPGQTITCFFSKKAR